VVRLFRLALIFAVSAFDLIGVASPIRGNGGRCLCQQEEINMAVVINTNSTATIAANNLGQANEMLKKSLSRLSSGSKIVNGSDDAGGLAVATRLEAGSKRAKAANIGVANAISFLQNQDSSLKTLSKIATRMNELQTMYRDASISDADKTNYNTEFTKLRARYEDIRTGAKHNGIKLLDDQMALSVTVDEAGTTYKLSDIDNSVTSADGRVTDLSSALITDGASFAAATGSAAFVANAGTSVTINNVAVTVTTNQTLAKVVDELNAKSGQTRVRASVDSGGTKLVLQALFSGEAINVTASALTASWKITADSSTNLAQAATALPDATKLALDDLSGARAKNGADQNALGYYVELGQATITNFEAAISRIVDVDVATESTQLARWTTLVQAGTAMLAQANGSTVSALSLLKG
jgi:flagellin